MVISLKKRHRVMGWCNSLHSVTNAVLHSYNVITTDESTWNTVTINQSKNGAFMISQSLLAVSDNVGMKGQRYSP